MKLSLLVAMSLLLPCALFAQTQANTQRVSLDYSFKYYECVDPLSTPTCVCATHAEKEKKCKGCKKWQEKPLTLSSQASFDATKYSHLAPDARSGAFINDAASKLWSQRLAANWRARDLLTESDKLGWTEVEGTHSKVGTLVVVEGVSGIVVSDKDGVLKVLYPSSKKNGELSVGYLNYLGDKSTAKFFIPSEFIAKQAMKESSSIK
jgi:hypothetical protein